MNQKIRHADHNPTLLNSVKNVLGTRSQARMVTEGSGNKAVTATAAARSLAIELDESQCTKF